MKIKIFSCFQNTAMIMAACLLSGSLLNLTINPNAGFSAVFIVQLFFFCFGTQIFWELLNWFPLNSRNGYYFCFYAGVYCFFLLFSFCIKWFPFTLKWILSESVLFAALCFLLHLYFSYMGKKQADEINRLINLK